MKDKSFYDVRISLPDGRSILSYKVLLAARSQKIRRHFQNAYKKSSSGAVEQVEDILPKQQWVTLSQISAQEQLVETLSLESLIGSTNLPKDQVSLAFEELHSFLYQDMISWEKLTVSHHRLCSFILLINKLKIPHLLNPSLETISKYLNAQNYVEFFNTILTLKGCNAYEDLMINYDPIYKICVNFFLDKQVFEKQKFDEFQMGKLSLEGVNILLKNMDHNEKMERKKFNVVMEWAKIQTDEKILKISEKDLLKYVDFEKLEINDLASELQQIRRIFPRRYTDIVERLLLQVASKCNAIQTDVVHLNLKISSSEKTEKKSEQKQQQKPCGK
ncbi:hypothetical protein G9A89_003424 [Geosiphon pyriformis]|nr:hypothetical protein G9A89_003424 [Geosiphon pyriformis]